MAAVGFCVQSYSMYGRGLYAKNFRLWIAGALVILPVVTLILGSSVATRREIHGVE